MNQKNDNVGKCGHARCAGGTGENCYYKGKPMQAYKPVNIMDNIYNSKICPSSLDEYGEPLTEGETAHRWDETTDPHTCAECGATRDEVKCICSCGNEHMRYED